VSQNEHFSKLKNGDRCGEIVTNHIKYSDFGLQPDLQSFKSVDFRIGVILFYEFQNNA
jgi:hypothetical protein